MRVEVVTECTWLAAEGSHSPLSLFLPSGPYAFAAAEHMIVTFFLFPLVQTLKKMADHSAAKLAVPITPFPSVCISLFFSVIFFLTTPLTNPRNTG